MRRVMLAIVLCACAQHLTHARKGWGSCAAGGATIVCGGKQMVQVECGSPASDSCGSLSLVYAGGERIVLAAHGARRPELASDGSRIWFRDPASHTDLWEVFDPQSGVMQEEDSYEIAVLHNSGAVPLWTGGAK